MRLVRRLVWYVAFPLAVVLVAAYGWYQWSDTGKRWRYEDELASYCGGLIPYAESSVFTSDDTEHGLPDDELGGSEGGGFRGCYLADLRVYLGLVPEDADRSSLRSDGGSMLRNLHMSSSDNLPMPLGGGWHGYTDLHNTGIVLSCTNKPASVVVAVAGDGSHANRREGRAMAELAAATARKAADRWSCASRKGGRVPPLPAPSRTGSPDSAAGTCAGVPLRGNDEVHWIEETRATDTSPLEECELGETKARSEPLYWLEASYGPYAQRRRSPDDHPHGAVHTDAGTEGRGAAWASAACPGAPRAMYRIDATEYAYPTGGFLLKALRGFAQRSAARHGCTDLKLPAG